MVVPIRSGSSQGQADLKLSRMHILRMIIAMVLAVARIQHLLATSTKIVNTSYYDILGLKPDTSDAELREKFQYLICYAFNPERHGPREEEARKSQKILKNISTVLLDPQLRQDYDQNGPKFKIDVFELEKFQFEAILRYFLNCRLPDDKIGGYYTSYQLLDSLGNAHVRNQIGKFCNTLLNLMKSSYFSFIMHDPYAEIQENGISNGPHMFSDFQMFLKSIIRKYESDVNFVACEYTLFERIADLLKFLDNPTFILVYARDLSPEFLYMLLRKNPFEFAKIILSSDHPLFDNKNA